MKYSFNILLVLLLSVSSRVGAAVNIVPQPTHVDENIGVFTLKSGQSIGYNSAQIASAATYLRTALTRATGFNISTRQGKGTISLELLTPGDNRDESYTLQVTPQGVTISAFCYSGIVNGIASLRQLFPPELESQTIQKGITWTAPAVEIQDQPVYHWRGLMLDPVRHFYSVEETKRFLDHMALYKFNKFHWHLTDGQAWRIHINKYPKLTSFGAWRKPLPDIDQQTESRAKSENNPTLLLPRKYFRTIDGEEKYGGFYTQQEVREVVRYAAQRGIDVVPEIDMPGHNWITTQCYPWLSCGGDGNDPLCLGKQSTFDFAENVWSEVFRLFPYEYVHIGGDEVYRNRWQRCADCQKRIKEEGLKDVNEYQAWFTKKMEQFFNKNGRKLMGWDEILEGGVSQTATVYWWRGDHPDVAQKSTAMGNEVVVCPTTYCYFDYGQDNQTLERLYTANIVPTDLTSEQHCLIKGIQANIWCEWIPTEARMQFMVFPRALALAEKAWTPTQQQSWSNFKQRLSVQLPRLSAAGINYRPLETDIK